MRINEDKRGRHILTSFVKTEIPRHCMYYLDNEHQRKAKSMLNKNNGEIQSRFRSPSLHHQSSLSLDFIWSRRSTSWSFHFLQRARFSSFAASFLCNRRHHPSSQSSIIITTIIIHHIIIVITIIIRQQQQLFILYLFLQICIYIIIMIIIIIITITKIITPHHHHHHQKHNPSSSSPQLSLSNYQCYQHHYFSINESNESIIVAY